MRMVELIMTDYDNDDDDDHDNSQYIGHCLKPHLLGLMVAQ